MRARIGHRAVRGASALVLALLVGASWAVASPPGSSPDDDYHTASIWCAWGEDARCQVLERPAPAAPLVVSVPDLAILVGFCTAFQSEVSASCVFEGADGGAGRPAPETFPVRANNGGYPDGYYSTLRALRVGSPEAAIVAMRILTFAACLALFAAAGLASAASDRWRFWFFSAIASVPLGMFVFASTNPSSVAIAGAAATYPATLGALRRVQAGKRWWPHATLCAVAIMAAVSSRPDAYYFCGLAFVCAVIVGLGRGQVRRQAAALAAGATALIIGLATTNRPTELVGEGSPASVWVNLVSLPSLYLGEFATLLGWMDTRMPSLVWASMAVALGGILMVGMQGLDARRGVALGVALVVSAALPLYILDSSQAGVGQVLQPRYLLPLVFLVMGVLALSGRSGVHGPDRFQALWLAGIAAIAHGAALHVLIRRYVTGQDVASLNLNAAAEWWWDVPVTPMAVWLVGSVSFAALVLLMGRCSVARSLPGDSPIAQSPNQGDDSALVGTAGADK